MVFRRKTIPSLRSNIIIFFLINQIVILAVIVYIAIDVRKAQNSMYEQLNRTQEINSLVTQLSEQQKELQISVLSYLFDKSDVNRYQIKRDEADLQKIFNTVNSMQMTGRAEELKKVYTSTHIGVDALRNELLFSIETDESDKLQSKLNQWFLSNSRRTAALEDLKNYHLKSYERFLLEYDELFDKLGISIVMIFLVSLLGGAVLFKYVNDGIVKPVSDISIKSLMLSSGTYTNFDEVNTNKELQELSHSLNVMANDIRGNYVKLQEEISEKERVIIKNKELEARKDDFVSMASHELKTPITSLKVFVQIIDKMAKEKQDTTLSKYINAMQKQLDRLSSLVVELLDVTNIRGGSLGLIKLPTDLNELVRDITANVKQITSTHKFKIIESNCPVVFIDKDRIGQVVLNILSNAVKYSPVNSRIQVTTSCTGSEVIVSIKDQGIGIAKEYQEKIFDRFFRVYDENEKTFPGLGMGLYISYVIVKKHEGRMWVESELGKGSTFYFSLPVNTYEKSLNS